MIIKYRQMTIEFYSKKKPYYEFSNYYGAHIDKKYKLTVDGVNWLTTEHYYQSMKFDNAEYIKLIRECSTPYKAYCLGKIKKPRFNWKHKPDGISMYDIIDKYKSKVTIIRGWDAKIKCKIMLKVLRAKFGQNEHLKKLLLDTGNRTLIESSPRDSYWGRYNGNGINMLGKLLMKVRKELKTK